MHITLNEAMLDGIARMLNELGHGRYDDVHIQPIHEPECPGFWAASTVIATADVDTLESNSFYVSENGETWRASHGESVSV